MIAAKEERLSGARLWVREELERCADFWTTHGPDRRAGGIFTCLDREGQVYSTDKSVWMQGRAAWTFSRLCARYGIRQEWLGIAESCLDFMEKHCINRNAGNRMYFTVTGDGRPLRQRRYCFSEAFYAMANAEYYALTGIDEHLKRARAAYELVWNLNRNEIPDPAGLGPKTIPETRAGRALADPMIYLNLSGVMRRADPQRSALYSSRSAVCAEEILRLHRKKDLGCTLEMVGREGEFFSDVSAGRVVNPGHSIECSWFLMEEAKCTDDGRLLKEARSMFFDAAEGGWDREYGGFLYFVDCLGKPPESYEHDMKLWWPHTEALIAALMGWRDTGEEAFLEWFFRTADYCRQAFCDPQYAEWYGYLRRDGKPTMPPCKGSTFKGPFHLPRALMMADELL